MSKRWLAVASCAVLAVFGGLALLEAGDERHTPFHDFRVMDEGEYLDLVDPHHAAIRAKAREFRSHQEAYAFVRDSIRYVPYIPAGGPHKALEAQAASCLGKAALLCSFYRAMGMKPGEVRVVTGIVGTPGGLAEHAWVDLEYQGECYQQDPSGFLGRFEFHQFPKDAFVREYVVKENFCFNDEEFGVVSQLNRMGRTD